MLSMHTCLKISLKVKKLTLMFKSKPKCLKINLNNNNETKMSKKTKILKKNEKNA